MPGDALQEFSSRSSIDAHRQGIISKEFFIQPLIITWVYPDTYIKLTGMTFRNTLQQAVNGIKLFLMAGGIQVPEISLGDINEFLFSPRNYRLFLHGRVAIQQQWPAQVNIGFRDFSFAQGIFIE